jgi:hypothetical protein
MTIIGDSSIVPGKEPLSRDLEPLIMQFAEVAVQAPAGGLG